MTAGLYVLWDNAYSIRRDWVRSDAAKKYEQYSKELDRYLIEQAKMTADDMDYFYKNLDYTPGYGVVDENDPAVTKAIETMVGNVGRFLVMYCGFTQAEAESMRELSGARGSSCWKKKWGEAAG